MAQKPKNRRRSSRRRHGEEADSADGFSRWAPVPVNSPLIDDALSFWQPRAPRPLSREDAREIIENMTGFFAVLMEWEMAERTKTHPKSKREPPAE